MCGADILTGVAGRPFRFLRSKFPKDIRMSFEEKKSSSFFYFMHQKQKFKTFEFFNYCSSYFA
jgi:hypothetical protein